MPHERFPFPARRMKTFDGKRYEFQGTYDHKADAINVAHHLKMGAHYRSVRILREHDGFSVFAR